MNRSSAAAEISLSQLVAASKFVYLWTFTFEDTTERRHAAKCWKAFRRDLGHQGVDLRCVRTFELHPNGHGIHIHFVTPDFHHVNLIRPMALRAGFGRIHAKRITAARAGYVLKYIKKCFRTTTEALKGARKWHVCGSDRKEWGQTCRTVKVDTDYTRAWGFLKSTFRPWVTLRWFEKKAMVERLMFNSIAQGFSPHWTEWDWQPILGGVGWRLVRVDAPF